jgi:hypothetical protein
MTNFVLATIVLAMAAAIALPAAARQVCFFSSSCRLFSFVSDIPSRVRNFPASGVEPEAGKTHWEVVCNC